MLIDNAKYEYMADRYTKNMMTIRELASTDGEDSKRQILEATKPGPFALALCNGRDPFVIKRDKYNAHMIFESFHAAYAMKKKKPGTFVVSLSDRDDS